MKRKLLIILFLTFSALVQVFAQNRTVTGTVTAREDGLPIPGVSVKLKGTNEGTQTNTAGKYSISVPAGSTLIFSFIGYESQQVAVTGTTLNITLTLSNNQLGEVVVTGALGIKTQSKQLGYSTATIDNKMLTQAKVTDIATGLSGKVSGLQINLADNGVDPSVRIVLRGNRSLTGNNQALLVVDGVPIEDNNYLNTINPEDIQDINILKGAVAAAIYGSKASNGVMILTTKKGTKGKTSITVSNTTQIQSVSYLPNLQTTFGPYGGEPGYTNANGTTRDVPYENQNYGPPFDGSMQPLALSPIFAKDGVTVVGYDTLFNRYSAIKNNRRDFFNNAISNQFNVGIDAGDDNSTLHVGFQDATINGVVPNDVDRRDNIRIGGLRTFGKFSIEYNASYNQSSISTYGPSYNQTSGGLTGDALYFEVLNIGANIPVTSFKDINGKYSNINSYYNAYATNPYWTLTNSRQNTVNYDWLANTNLALKITPWLTLSDRIGLTSRTFTFKATRPQLQFAPWAIADPWHAGNVPSSEQYVYAAEADQSFLEQRLNNDMILAFNKKFGLISVNALVGSNLEQNYQRTLGLGSTQLQFPGDFNVGSGLGIPSYGESNFQQREAAVYEEATLGYHDYVFLHITNRDEWNSVLAQDKNHYEYPSADLSFVFTDAISSLKDKDDLSYGKIHAGITRVANINLGGGVNPYGAYSLVNVFNTAPGFPFGSLGGYSLSGLNLSPNIKPEQTTEYEVGAELGFLKNRINFKVTVYHSDSRDQSLTQNLSSATGFNQQITNVGLVTNDGQEFDLNLIPVKTTNWNWNLGINFSHYSNKVVSLGQGQTQLQLPGAGSIYAVVGKPYPVIETNDFNRDPQGRVIVDANTGLPSINSALTIYGNTNPTRILGITSSLTYKSWNLSFVVDYRGGNQIFNTIGGTEAFTGISSQSAQNGRQRFIFPNSVINTGTAANPVYTPNTSVAVDNGGNTEGFGFWPTIYSSSLGSIYVDDASFIKLREATFTYTVPAGFLAKNASFIKKASIGLVGRNLLMFRPKSNTFTDPEFSDAGSGNATGTTSVNQTPPTRFYGANLTLTF
jgi:TonB-linked SusC/RagA family outer membrane protein